MLGKGKQRFIEVESKKRKKGNNERSKICFVHTILSRIVEYIYTFSVVVLLSFCNKWGLFDTRVLVG